MKQVNKKNTRLILERTTNLVYGKEIFHHNFKAECDKPKLPFNLTPMVSMTSLSSNDCHLGCAMQMMLNDSISVSF